MEIRNGKSEMNENAIVARNLRKAYVRNKEVVKGLDLTVKRGDQTQTYTLTISEVK